MNIWTQRSLDLANQRDYLDQLFKVYPMAPETIREVNKGKWAKVESAFGDKDNATLLKNLLDLDLFPIKDSYVPYFRRDRTSIDRNPETVNRLAGRLYEMGLDTIWDRATQPKETNRQIGPLFKRWLDTGVLGVPTLTSPEDFLNATNNCILNISDAGLKLFAQTHLGYDIDKGLDFIGKFNGKYVIGEAKFLTDFGGHQDRQFDDAMKLASFKSSKAICVGILDGVVYIPSRGRMYREVTSDKDRNIMSSLMLRDFLYQV